MDGGVASLPDETAPPWLEKATERVGLDVVHDPRSNGGFLMPEIIGPGMAVADFDSDGRLDLYFTAHGPNRLLRQTPAGRFVEVEDAGGAADPGFGMGCAIGDLDNDGDLDLFVTNYGADTLFRNDGLSGFVDITGAAGVGGGERWSTSAAFFDADADGWLDLWVTRYIAYDPLRVCAAVGGRREYCGPESFPGVADSLFLNRGDGTFADVSVVAGISRTAGKGLGVLAADLDGDGRSEVFVANDGEPNSLWVAGSGDGLRFEDRAVLYGVAVNLRGQPEASMGVAVGDVDLDGDLDLFATHLVDETNTLYLNAGGGGFEDRVGGSGLGGASLPFTGFGTALFDADLDGVLDLAVVNGRVKRVAGDETELSDEGGLVAAYGEPNLLFAGLGGGRFVDACARAPGFCAPAEIGRGLAPADVDADGDVDLVVSNTAGPARIYDNVAARAGRWVRLRVVDPAFGRDAIGARLRVTAAERTWTATVGHTTSYLVSVDAAVHLGLGAVERVDRVAVLWPGGGEESFGPLEVDREHALEKGSGLAKGGGT